MGNVLASSKPPGTDFPASFAYSQQKEESPKNEKIENPGAMEDLHKKCKDVFPINFEGAKVVLNKGLSNHFQVSHTINMSSTQPGGYRFGATYVGTKQSGPNEAFPVLLGDIDSLGNLNANIIHQIGNRIRARFQTQVQGNVFAVSQLTCDYRGDDYTASFTVANPDIINKTGVLVGHYLQNVTPKLALGTEIAYQSSPQVPGGQIAVLSLAARYTGSDFTWSSTFGPANLHVCYYQRASEQLQFGVELETNFRMQEAVGTIAYQVDIPKADMSFKGMVDSNWNVGCVLEKKLLPMPFTLALSGLINHSKNNFRLGLGFIIG